MAKNNDVVKNAWKKHILVPSINASYLPMIEPIVQAIKDQDSFALIETCQIEWEEMGSKGPQEVMEEFQKWEDSNHVRLHIDHIPSIHQVTGKPNDYYGIIKETIEIGYPSVMIDTTAEKDENKRIEIIGRIVELAHKHDVLVEAEAGLLYGYSAKNTLPYEDIFTKRLGFTTEEEALRMVKETGCDWLGVAVGNIHGILLGKEQFHEKVAAKLDVELVRQINNLAQVPLVLHGGSNIQVKYIHEAVKEGIAKMNVAKAIRLPYQLMMRDNRSILELKQMVYERVTELIRDEYNISGTSKILMRNGDS